jgi:SlyX protein
MRDAETTERFILLETKIAYQEKLLQELSDLLREKGLALEHLALRLQRLEGAAQNASEGELLPHDRPPHY